MPYFYKTTLAAICFPLCFSAGAFARFKTEVELEDAVITGRMKEGQTHPNHTKIQALQRDITERRTNPSP